MADTATLTSMIARCRRLSNQETTDQANALCTDAEITDHLNHELRIVYNALVAARGGSYYRATYSFSTVAGTEAYALPAAFYQLLICYVTAGGGNRVPIPMMTDSEAYDYETNFGVVRSQYPERYQLRAGTIALAPIPSSVVSVSLVYVPAFTTLSSGSDTFDGVGGFYEAAVWRVVAAMQTKDELDPSFAMGKAQEWDAQIRALASDRDAGQPLRIQRVRRNRDRWIP